MRSAARRYAPPRAGSVSAPEGWRWGRRGAEFTRSPSGLFDLLTLSSAIATTISLDFEP